MVLVGSRHHSKAWNPICSLGFLCSNWASGVREPPQPRAHLNCGLSTCLAAKTSAEGRQCTHSNAWHVLWNSDLPRLLLYYQLAAALQPAVPSQPGVPYQPMLPSYPAVPSNQHCPTRQWCPPVQQRTQGCGALTLLIVSWAGRR